MKLRSCSGVRGTAHILFVLDVFENYLYLTNFDVQYFIAIQKISTLKG